MIGASGRLEATAPRVLILLGVIGSVPVIRSLFVPDLNWCYPFMMSDSYDWVANGLFLAGEKVATTWRPPGLPALIAALWKAGALRWLPVLNYAVLGLITAALYRLLRERHGAWISAAASWFFFANDFVQDLTKYVLAEVFCTLFIVLAAHAFVRAARDPRLYRTCALLLALGFLFHHATAVVGLGFAVAMVVTRRADLRRKEPWQGLAASAVVAGGWALLRWSHGHANPGGRWHAQEELLGFAPENVRFYVVAGIALLGIAILPLYGAGFLRLVKSDFPNPAYRVSVLAPLLSLSLFWLFFYDWADKRFLTYQFPFCVCLLAEGLESLLAFARRGRLAAGLAGVFLGLALLWNGIRYPSYGTSYVALTPLDFFEARAVQSGSGKTIFGFRGGRVVRLHETLGAGFSGSLFDVRLEPPSCSLDAPVFTCLGSLKADADRLLVPGEPIGFDPPAGWSPDFYTSLNRLGNVLLRPVVRPPRARISLVGRDAAKEPSLASCGPYALVSSR